MKKVIVWTSFGLFLSLLILALRPISISKYSCKYVQGLVDTAYVNETADLIIKLKSDDRTFYINRFADEKNNIPEFLNKLLSNNVTVYYADHWTPLDPFNSYRHLVQVKLSDKILYSELRQ